MRCAVWLVPLLSLVACGQPAPVRDSLPGEAPPTAPQAAARGAFPRQVVDGAGNALDLRAAPRRIISQTLATDELLFAMIEHARIAGVSSTARDPAYSNVVAEATALRAPAIVSAEQALALRPDLIFVASFSRAEIVKVLQASGAPVYRFTSFDRLEDVKTNIRRVGAAVGAEAAGETLIAGMEARLARVRARRGVASAAPPRVLSYTASGFTAGSGTTWDDIVRWAVAVNVAAAAGLKGFPRISGEQVLAWQPDYIVAGINPGERESVLRQLRDNPAVASTAAVKTGRVIFLDNRALLSVSHHIVDAVEALADALDRQPLTR